MPSNGAPANPSVHAGPAIHELVLASPDGPIIKVRELLSYADRRYFAVQPYILIKRTSDLARYRSYGLRVSYIMAAARRR